MKKSRPPRLDEHKRDPLVREHVTIRFVKVTPDDEIVGQILRCASRLVHASSPIDVLIEPHRYGYQVKIEGTDVAYPVIEVEPDVFVAIRNAFARWDAAASVQLAPSHLTAAM